MTMTTSKFSTIIYTPFYELSYVERDGHNYNMLTLHSIDSCALPILRVFLLLVILLVLQ